MKARAVTGVSSRGVPVTVRATIDATPQRTFEVIVPINLALIFRGLGPLPAVVEVREQSGPWDHVGAHRRPVFSDGTAAFEQLTDYVPFSYFAYDLSGFTNILGRLVTGAHGGWQFAPIGGGGTAVTWTYTFLPLRLRYALVRFGVAPIWRLYMRRALVESVREVERQLRA
jgi:hypothetical protein